jgi:hypothetical protein
MRAALPSLALALMVFGSEAEALTLFRPSGPPGAQLATEGLGYSVVQAPSARARSFRVVLACTVAWRNAVAHCPTPAHSAYCPQAKIVCR